MSLRGELGGILVDGFHETWDWLRLFAVGAAWGLAAGCLLLINPDSLPARIAGTFGAAQMWLVVVAPAASAWAVYAISRIDSRSRSFSVASLFPLFLLLSLIGISLLLGQMGELLFYAPPALALIGVPVTIAALWRHSHSSALTWIAIVAVLGANAAIGSQLPLPPGSEEGVTSTWTFIAVLAVVAASFFASAFQFVLMRTRPALSPALRQTEQALQPGAPKVGIES